MIFVLLEGDGSLSEKVLSVHLLLATHETAPFPHPYLVKRWGLPSLMQTMSRYNFLLSGISLHVYPFSVTHQVKKLLWERQRTNRAGRWRKRLVTFCLVFCNFHHWLGRLEAWGQLTEVVMSCHLDVFSLPHKFFIVWSPGWSSWLSVGLLISALVMIS